MIILKISPDPSSDLNREMIRQLIGFYHGVASFSGTGVIHINPKEGFNFDGLMSSLSSSGYDVKQL